MVAAFGGNYGIKSINQAVNNITSTDFLLNNNITVQSPNNVTCEHSNYLSLDNIFLALSENKSDASVQSRLQRNWATRRQQFALSQCSECSNNNNEDFPEAININIWPSLRIGHGLPCQQKAALGLSPAPQFRPPAGVREYVQ